MSSESKRDNLLQTKAVMFLIKNNYELIDDINNVDNVDNKKMYFEAYQALELANELCHINGMKLNNIHFSQLLIKIQNNNLDLNLNKINNNLDKDNTTLENYIIPSAPYLDNNSNINVNLDICNKTDTRLTNEWLDNEKNYYKSKLQSFNNNMICTNPEHHTLNDKINYYDK